jgi:hypothetical protein
MKTFIQWCEEKGNKLDFIEKPEAEEATSESGSAKRAAVRSHAYPPLYGRGQYTKGYFNPSVADNLAYNKD